jgi:hypothetical protein
MNRLKRLVISLAWVATTVFLVPIWVPMAIFFSTTLILKEMRGDSDG